MAADALSKFDLLFFIFSLVEFLMKYDVGGTPRCLPKAPKGANACLIFDN
jgi:hypothetical protein